MIRKHLGVVLLFLFLVKYHASLICEDLVYLWSGWRNLFEIFVPGGWPEILEVDIERINRYSLIHRFSCLEKCNTKQFYTKKAFEGQKIDRRDNFMRYMYLGAVTLTSSE